MQSRILGVGKLLFGVACFGCVLEGVVSVIYARPYRFTLLLHVPVMAYCVVYAGMGLVEFISGLRFSEASQRWKGLPFKNRLIVTVIVFLVINLILIGVLYLFVPDTVPLG